jgi:hypothetical protein
MLPASERFAIRCRAYEFNAPGSALALFDPRPFAAGDQPCHTVSMWPGFDPQLRKEFEAIRQMTKLRFQTPVKEWPLTWANRDDGLLVIRQWPDGSITAYLSPDRR